MSQDPIELITPETLQSRVTGLRDQGYRLVQISATRMPAEVELTYSFDKNNRLTHLRYSVTADKPHIPSISSVFACAVLYENEIHDLFDVKVDGLALDFGGNFYRTSVKFPFLAAPEAKPAAATPPAAPPAGSPARS
jgi:ech hydrogenase subunit D